MSAQGMPDPHPNADIDTHCLVCTRDCTVNFVDPNNGQTVKGLAPVMELCLHAGPISDKEMKRVYPELDVNRHYRICMVCIIKAFWGRK